MSTYFFLGQYENTDVMITIHHYTDHETWISDVKNATYARYAMIKRDDSVPVEYRVIVIAIPDEKLNIVGRLASVVFQKMDDQFTIDDARDAISQTIRHDRKTMLCVVPPERRLFNIVGDDVERTLRDIDGHVASSRFRSVIHLQLSVTHEFTQKRLTI